MIRWNDAYVPNSKRITQKWWHGNPNTGTEVYAFDDLDATERGHTHAR